MSEELATLREQGLLLRSHLAAAELPPPLPGADAGAVEARCLAGEPRPSPPTRTPAHTLTPLFYPPPLSSLRCHGLQRVLEPRLDCPDVSTS